MAAPDVFTLYDFEGQIEPTIAAILTTALAGTVPPITCQVSVTRDSTTNDTPGISITVSPGAPLGHMTAAGQANPKQVPDMFDATLTVSISTTRPIDNALTDPLHGILRGLCRYYLSAGAKVFNDTNMPYLQIIEMLPASSASGIPEANKEQDMTVLIYSLKFAIRPDAWPATA